MAINTGHDDDNDDDDDDDDDGEDVVYDNSNRIGFTL